MSSAPSVFPYSNEDCDLGCKPGGHKWPTYEATPDQSGFGMPFSPVDGTLLRSTAIYRLQVGRFYPF